MIDRIRNTSILGYALIVEVDSTVFCYSYVFEQSVAADCTVDVRFALFVEFDNLCIATTFEVEYTIVVPSVFIVTD